jgi:hypothetical protein
MHKEQLRRAVPRPYTTFTSPLVEHTHNNIYLPSPQHFATRKTALDPTKLQNLVYRWVSMSIDCDAPDIYCKQSCLIAM